MSVSDPEEKARNREIAQNEAERETMSDVRVSSWAIVIAVVIGALSYSYAISLRRHAPA